MSESRARIVDYLARSRDAVAAAFGDEVLLATIAAAVDRVCAADAQHLASELAGKFEYDRVPADATPLVQQLHITIGHLVCGLVEERLFPRAGARPPLAAIAE